MYDSLLWAMHDAPTATANERLVLEHYALHADPDGCNAFPSHSTIARRTHLDAQTVKRTVRSLLTRRLMARGDQSAATALPRNYRPVVYDLMVPAGWFPNLERINADRASKGKPPLTGKERPLLAPAPAKSKRSDTGRKRIPEGSTSPLGGVSETPLGDNQGGLQDPSEGSTRPVGGVFKTGPGGLEDPQPSPYLKDQKDPWSSSVVTPGVPGARVGDWEEDKSGGVGLAPDVREALDLLHRVPAPAGRRGMTYTEMLELVPFVVRCLGDPWPWSKIELLHELSRDLGDARNVQRLLLQRLSSQIDPLRVPDDGGLWAHERPPVPVAQVLVDCVECQAPMKAATHDGMCVGCRNTLLRAMDDLSAQVRSEMEPVDLVDVDQEDQVPGQLGVPVEYQQVRDSLRRPAAEAASPAGGSVE